MSELVESIKWIKSFLTEEQYDILWLYTVENETLKRIGYKYNITKQAVEQRLNTIYKKVQENLDKSKFQALCFRESIIPKESVKEADTAKIKVAYLCDYLRNVNDGLEKRVNKRGKEYFVPKKICKIPEYLLGSFGDKNTVCSMCTNEDGIDKCKRKEFWAVKEKFYEQRGNT